jgi:hypothetical protein
LASLPRPDRLWGSPSLLSSGDWGFLFQGYSSRGMKQTTHLHQVPRLRMRGAVSQLPQYVFMAWHLLSTGKSFLPIIIIIIIIIIIVVIVVVAAAANALLSYVV